MIGELAASANPLPEISGVEVAIPFRDDMRQAILDGRKCCTTRGRQYGRPGDYFVLGTLDNKRYFRLINIARVTLDFVAHQLFKEEGVSSPAEFIALWIAIHPQAGWQPNEKKYTHFFQEVRP